jgi:hypothetical protein
MTSTKQINLSSSDGISHNGTMKSHIDFTFKNLLSKNDSIERVEFSVDNCQIPVSFYNVNSSNNTFKISIDGGSIVTITIPKGNYNTTSLISTLTQQLINNTITSISITLSTINGLLSFSIVSGYFTLHSSSIFPILGFELGQDYTSVTQVLNSIFPVNLLGTLKLKLTSNNIHVSNYDSKNGGSLMNTLLELPISASNFGLILYTNNSNIHSTLEITNINTIDIHILDDKNEYIDFNNIDWAITLLIKIFYKVKSDTNTIKEIPKDLSEATSGFPKDLSEATSGLTDDEILLNNE